MHYWSIGATRRECRRQRRSQTANQTEVVKNIIAPDLRKKIAVAQLEPQKPCNEIEAKALVREKKAQILSTSFVRSTSPANTRAQLHESSKKTTVVTLTPEATERTPADYIPKCAFCQEQH